MLNMAIEMGRLVASPELKHTSKKIAFTRFTLAVDRGYKKEGKKRGTDFINFVAWRSNAEYACKYLRKGRLAVVRGKMQTRTYQDTQGVRHKVFEIAADEIHCLGNPVKKDGQAVKE